MTITKHLKSLFRPTINGFAMRHASASVTIAQTHGIQNSGAYKEIRARLTCCDTQPDLKSNSHTLIQPAPIHAYAHSGAHVPKAVPPPRFSATAP